MKRFLTVASVAIVLALGTASAQAGKGNKADKPNKADKVAKRNAEAVTGKVQKVDGATLTVLAGRGKKAAEVTVTTDADTKVKVNGQDGTLAQIKPGMRVVATPNTGTAKMVRAMDVKEGAGKGKNKNAGPTPDKNDAK